MLKVVLLSVMHALMWMMLYVELIVYLLSRICNSGTDKHATRAQRDYWLFKNSEEGKNLKKDFEFNVCVQRKWERNIFIYGLFKKKNISSTFCCEYKRWIHHHFCFFFVWQWTLLLNSKKNMQNLYWFESWIEIWRKLTLIVFFFFSLFSKFAAQIELDSHLELCRKWSSINWAVKNECWKMDLFIFFFFRFVSFCFVRHLYDMSLCWWFFFLFLFLLFGFDFTFECHFILYVSAC